MNNKLSAEEYLEQINLIDGIIVNKMRDYKRWRELADGYGGGFSVGEKVQASKDLQRGASAIIEYVSIENEISALNNKRQGIINTIQSLPHLEYKILYAIYVDGLMVKELPSLLNKSYETIKITKRKALEHIEDIINR